VSIPRFETAVQAATEAITDTQKAGLELGNAVLLQEEDPGEDNTEAIAEPHKQHRPVSAVIDPEPKEDEISEIQIAPQRRMISAVEIATEDAPVQTASDRMINDGIAMHQYFISRAMYPVSIFGIAIVERQVLPASQRAGSRKVNAIHDRKVD